MTWGKEITAEFTTVMIRQQNCIFWILIHLLPFPLLVIDDVKANFIYLFFKFIHYGIDPKFLKRRGTCPLTLLGPCILSGHLHLFYMDRVSELFAPGAHCESSKFELLNSDWSEESHGGISSPDWRLVGAHLLQIFPGRNQNVTCCKYFGVWFWNLLSAMFFWPVKLDNSKVLRKQRQRDVNVARVTLLQIWMILRTVKTRIKAAIKWNLL